MKEIRTIKMVEHTEIKFVADDGKEFIGENAEKNCMDYERTRDINRVKEAIKRVDFKEFKMPFVDWFSDDYGYAIAVLNSKSDYIALMDYYKVVKNVWDNYIEEPKNYPYTMTVYYTYDTVGEYCRDIKADLKKALADLGE